MDDPQLALFPYEDLAIDAAAFLRDLFRQLRIYLSEAEIAGARRTHSQPHCQTRMPGDWRQWPSPALGSSSSPPPPRDPVETLG